MDRCSCRYRPVLLFSGRLILMAIFLFLSVLAKARPLVVGTMWFPPFYEVKRDGDRVTKISGINVEIISKVLDRIGETYTLELYPTKRLYANLAKGSTDVFYGIRIPEKVLPASAILHSHNKISRITLRVYSIGNTPNITKKEDLVGRSIIVFRGYGYGGFITFVRDPKNHMQVLVADTQANGFKMLKKGRAKYLLAFERPARVAIRSLPKNYFSDLKWSPPLYFADGYFIISRKTPNAEQLRQRMDQAYLELKDEGAFDGLLVK